jgi:hypothetical protein
MFVCCECCVLSDRGLCDGLIIRPEESYRLWSVVVCDQETSKTRRLSPLTGCESTTTMGCNARKQTNMQIFMWSKLIKCYDVLNTFFFGNICLHIKYVSKYCQHDCTLYRRLSDHLCNNNS